MKTRQTSLGKTKNKILNNLKAKTVFWPSYCGEIGSVLRVRQNDDIFFTQSLSRPTPSPPTHPPSPLVMTHSLRETLFSKESVRLLPSGLSLRIFSTRPSFFLASITLLLTLCHVIPFLLGWQKKKNFCFRSARRRDEKGLVIGFMVG